MTALLLPPPFITALDANGNPIANATLTFYLAGTSTLATVYADADQTTPLTNPVTANAAGRFPAIYAGANQLRALLKDAGGVTIRDTDPVNSAVGDDANVRDFGAVGDGVTNDTVAVNAAVVAATPGGNLHFPAGTYLVDQIVINKQLHITLDDGATVKLRSITDADTGVFKFIDTAAGSSLSGGAIDGNRVALLATYLAFPRESIYGGAAYVIQSEINGILAEPCARLRVHDITIQNCLTHAFVHRGGADAQYRNIRVIDCAKVCNVQFSDRAFVDNIRGRGIGNKIGTTSIPFYQPAYEIRDMVESTFTNLYLDDFSPTVRDGAGLVIGDPYPTAFAFERMTGGVIKNLRAASYTFDAADNKTTSMGVGFILSSFQNVDLSGLYAKGFYYGAQAENLQECNPTDCVFDGNYNTVATNPVLPGAEARGLALIGGGIYPFATPLPDNDYRTNSGSRGVTWSNSSILRYVNGVDVRSGHATFSNVQSYANLKNGWTIDKADANTSFPSGVRIVPDKVSLFGCGGFNNGWGGISVVEGIEIEINGGNWDNNGQETTDAFLAVGINTITTAAKPGLSVTGGSGSDTQTFTKADCASYIPGATVNNRITMLMSDPDQMEIGQKVTIDGKTCKIVNIDRDVFTMQTAAPATFNEAGHLTNLVGTMSSAGNIVTGVGTAFNTAIVGPVYIKAGGQYKRVAKIYSATSLQTVEAFSPALTAGTTGQLVQADVVGIPSQQWGMFLVTQATKVGWSGLRTDGNTAGRVFIENTSSLIGGQEFTITNLVNVNTSGTDTSIAGPFTAAQGLIPKAAKVEVVTSITGTVGATGTLGFGTDSTFTSVLTGIALTAATTISVPVTTVPATPNNLFPAFRIEGGSDNIPSGGSVRAAITFRKQTVEPT